MTIDYYIKKIKRVLKGNNTYNIALDIQIQSLASALRNLDMANEQIDSLTETTVIEKTRYGSKLAPHPVFKIAKDAQELITRQMKALGMTADALTTGADKDPITDLTKELMESRKESKTIYMKGASEADD